MSWREFSFLNWNHTIRSTYTILHAGIPPRADKPESDFNMATSPGLPSLHAEHRQGMNAAHPGRTTLFPKREYSLMFFVIIFLSLASLASYFFPEWSWATVLLASLGCVVALRLALFFADRSSKAAGKTPQP